MVCNSSLLPNRCNDIAIISYTDSITLKRVFSIFKYGSNLSHKTLNVVYVTHVGFLNELSVHEPNSDRSTKPNILS
jgi:hypothetical protein